MSFSINEVRKVPFSHLHLQVHETHIVRVEYAIEARAPRAGGVSVALFGRDLALSETPLFFECFPYVCPEPVLAKSYENGAKRQFSHQDLVGSAAVTVACKGSRVAQEDRRPVCGNAVFLTLFVCLSRACLGFVMIILSF
jgi:hypothetical protein